MTSYELSRNYFDWCFENPEKITPNHTAIYFFAVEHCNRLGWKEKFGLPSQMVMDAIGIKNWRTYIKAFNDLTEWGFFELIEKSKNQYSSNIIAIVKNTKANTKALDKAMQTHIQKQGQSIVSIDKPINNITTNDITINAIACEFDLFWDIYNKKIDKDKCQKAWKKINTIEIPLILEKAKIYVKLNTDIQYRKNPLTWLNGKCWNDEISAPEKKIVYASHPIIFD